MASSSNDVTFDHNLFCLKYIDGSRTIQVMKLHDECMVIAGTAEPRQEADNPIFMFHLKVIVYHMILPSL
jgi:hypothetical protein